MVDINISSSHNNNKNNYVKKTILTAVLVSFLVGGVTGGVFGAVTGGVASDTIIPWFKANILRQTVTSQPVIQAANVVNQTLSVQEDSATIKVVSKVSPSVVSIIITKDLSKIYDQTGPNSFPFDDFFEFGFPFGSESQTPQGKQEIGGGTGFIISPDGLILTNKHVVSDTEAEYTVLTNEGKKYDATVLGTDPFNDLAVVKIEASELPVVELGDSDKIKIGQTVIAIGNTLGEYRNTVTKGVISGINRQIVAGDTLGAQEEIIEEAIQTDAAINPGNSGGPLINLVGQVIGVNTAVSREGQLVGFAIPVNQAKQIIESVIKEGRIIRPMLGVRYTLVNKEVAEANNLTVDYGALVIEGSQNEPAVIPGGPADKAGVRDGDVILELNEQKIDQDHTLAHEIQKYKPGDEVTLKILRGEEEKVLVATLVEIETSES